MDIERALKAQIFGPNAVGQEHAGRSEIDLRIEGDAGRRQDGVARGGLRGVQRRQHGRLMLSLIIVPSANAERSEVVADPERSRRGERTGEVGLDGRLRWRAEA